MVLNLTAVNVGLHFIQPNLRAGKTQENVQAMAVKFTDLKPYKKMAAYGLVGMDLNSQTQGCL